MKSKNKLKRGIFAIAIVLLCNPMTFAQSGRETTPTMATAKASSQQKHPAATELKNFKADANNPELSQMRLSLLEAKAALEAGMENNSLSQQTIAGMNRRINLLENKIKEKTQAKADKAGEQKPQQVMQRTPANPEAAQKASLLKALDQKQMTRAEFLTLSQAGQKEVMTNNVNIMDLVNATPEALKYRQDNIFYIPVSEFKGYELAKQIHILNNPSNYIVIEDAAATRTVNSYGQAPVQEVKKYKISKAELNSLSPEKKKAIENSKDFTITD